MFVACTHESPSHSYVRRDYENSCSGRKVYEKKKHIYICIHKYNKRIKTWSRLGIMSLRVTHGDPHVSGARGLGPTWNLIYYCCFACILDAPRTRRRHKSPSSSKRVRFLSVLRARRKCASHPLPHPCAFGKTSVVAQPTGRIRHSRDQLQHATTTCTQQAQTDTLTHTLTHTHTHTNTRTRTHTYHTVSREIGMI